MTRPENHSRIASKRVSMSASDHAQHMTGDAKAKEWLCFMSQFSFTSRRSLVNTGASFRARWLLYVSHAKLTIKWSRSRIMWRVSCAKSYARTPTDANAYRVGFSHAQHSVRQRLNCSECHNYKAGLPQRRQVDSPRALEHFPQGTGRARLVTMADDRLVVIWILRIARDVIRDRVLEWEHKL